MIDTGENPSSSDSSLTLASITWMIPTRVRLSHQLLKACLATSEGRSQALAATAEPIRFLLASTVPTSQEASHYLGILADILLRCDGTEVIDKALIVSNIQELSKYVTNPDIITENPLWGGF